MSRQMADDTPDRCRECGTVGDVVKRHGGMLCPECAQLDDDYRQDRQTMDCVTAMALMGASRTWS